MKSWCMFIVFLMCTSSISSWYLSDYHDALLNSPNVEKFFPTNLQSSYLEEESRNRRSSIVKRSQRNANILYRYCRRNGQAPQFCLRYAVTMVLATGH